MAADIDPMSTLLDADRIYVLNLARQDLYTRSTNGLTTPSYTVDTITKRAEEYLTWLRN